jgi:hypothetical protein
MSIRKSLPKTHLLLAALAGLVVGSPLALAQSTGSKPTTDSVNPKPSQPGQLPPQLSPVSPALKPGATPPPAPADHGIQPSNATDSPLEFDAMAFDFGNIPDTEDVTHVFKFRNKTDHKVVIRGAHGSCGCTVPALVKTTFEPSETGEMTVKFSPQHRRGANPKAVTIEYQEPAGTPNTIVTINSNVQPLVVVDPIKAFLMDVDTKEGKTMDVTISGRKPDFKVTSVDCKSELVQVTIGTPKEVVLDNDKFQQYPLTVTVLPKTPVGPVNTELTIHTNEEKMLTIPYFFNAEVVGDLKATPQQLAVRAFTPHVAFNNVATLESRSGKPFKIRSVDISGRDDMNLVVDVEPNVTPEKTTYTLKLNGVTPDITGVVSGDITVKTDLADNDEVKIRFTASIRGSQPPKAVSPNAN